MSLRNTVKFTHVALRLIPKILDTIDAVLPVFFVDEVGAVIDPVMLKIAHIQYIITGKIIGICKYPIYNTVIS